MTFDESRKSWNNHEFETLKVFHSISFLPFECSVSKSTSLDTLGLFEWKCRANWIRSCGFVIPVDFKFFSSGLVRFADFYTQKRFRMKKHFDCVTSIEAVFSSKSRTFAFSFSTIHPLNCCSLSARFFFDSTGLVSLSHSLSLLSID